MARLFPIGMQTFSEIRERNAIYIDKTEIIHQLVTTGKVYFLSRPRRFGKSLLISTLEAYFEGRKDLFQGLAIEKLESEWKNHPVLRIDMSGAKYVDIETLEEKIDILLSHFESLYGKKDASKKPSSRLTNVIAQAYEKTGQKVVVLVDEYDAPLLDSMVDDATFAKMRNIMRDFYSPLKACDAMLRFVFLTGITKFSQLSIFSELNNLHNISMLDKYCSLCGITTGEIETQLQPEIQEMATRLKISGEELIQRLKNKYDGYHFSPHSEDIFNPFSLLNALNDEELGNYWFSSGTPTFLAEKMKSFNVEIEDLDTGMAVRASSFDVPTESTDDPLPLMYQSGYLTIRSYSEEDVCPFTLGYPNEEVRVSFVELLCQHFTKQRDRQRSQFISNLVHAFRDNNLDEVLTLVRAFMSSIPYDAESQNELHYRTIIYLIFRIATPYLVRCEERSAAGRADVVVETDSDIYVIEFKLDGSVDDALRQIDSKGYLLPYEANGKTLHKIGVNFDTKTRTIGEWKVG